MYRILYTLAKNEDESTEQMSWKPLKTRKATPRKQTRMMMMERNKRSRSQSDPAKIMSLLAKLSGIKNKITKNSRVNDLC